MSIFIIFMIQQFYLIFDKDLFHFNDLVFHQIKLSKVSVPPKENCLNLFYKKFYMELEQNVYIELLYHFVIIHILLIPLFH